jgi:DNA polymerase V
VKDKKYSYEQLDMFSDVKKEEEDHTLENVLISIKEKYGKNAVVKASDLQEEATTLERNDQIGGHKA